MGHWGSDADANDTALDFAFQLNKLPIDEWVQKGLASTEYDEQRIAAEMLVRVGNLYDINVRDERVRVALEKLRAMLADEEWIGQWSKRKEIVDSLNQQIGDLEGLLPKPRSSLLRKLEGGG